jgi:hypothetical protein
VLFRRDVLDAIAAGRVTLAFGRWVRPRAVPGARHRTPIGLLEIVAVHEVARESITEDEARAGGAASLDALLRELTPARRARVSRGPAPRAAGLGVPTDVLKRDGRKIGELALTESLGTGYRLSRRGVAYLGRSR